MAIASGTFVYIGASEIVVEEFSVSNYKWTKFGFYLSGSLAIPFLIFYTDAD